MCFLPAVMAKSRTMITDENLFLPSVFMMKAKAEAEAKEMQAKGLKRGEDFVDCEFPHVLFMPSLRALSAARSSPRGVWATSRFPLFLCSHGLCRTPRSSPPSRTTWSEHRPSRLFSSRALSSPRPSGEAAGRCTRGFIP